MLGLVVVGGNVAVHLGEILCENLSSETLGLMASHALLLDNVTVDTAEEEVLGTSEEAAGGSPGLSVRLGPGEFLAGEGSSTGACSGATISLSDEALIAAFFSMSSGLLVAGTLLVMAG